MIDTTEGLLQLYLIMFIVSYTYPKTVAGRVFNFKNAIKNLNFDVGTTNMSCKCILDHLSIFRLDVL